MWHPITQDFTGSLQPSIPTALGEKHIFARTGSCCAVGTQQLRPHAVCEEELKQTVETTNCL